VRTNLETNNQLLKFICDGWIPRTKMYDCVVNKSTTTVFVLYKEKLSVTHTPSMKESFQMKQSNNGYSEDFCCKDGKD